MAGLPTTGEISLSQIAGEFGGEKPHGLNEYYKSPNGLVPASTTNNKVPTSGQISFDNFYGAVNRVSGSGATVTLDNLQVGYLNYVFNPSKLGTGYISGSTDALLFINSGVYVWSDSITLPGLEISGWATGDTVTIVNNGYIMGKGGRGAWVNGSGSGLYGGTRTSGAAQQGGPAVLVKFTVSLFTNNGYVGGGGGGGGSAAGDTSTNYCIGSGGGGAGGGAGGDTWYYTAVPGNTTNYTLSGGTGGAIGLAGGDGKLDTSGSYGSTGANKVSGAAGGRIMPGTGGTGGVAKDTYVLPKGGGAGGGGGGAGISFSYGTAAAYGGAGGDAGSPGGAGSTSYSGGTQYQSAGRPAGGGGGWGAKGGDAPALSGYWAMSPGAQGGAAFSYSGGSVTFDTKAVAWNSRIYGSY